MLQQQDPAVSAVAHAIQLAVAPVFLLTAIGALLGVLANRLARIVDRSRAIAARHPAVTAAEQAEIEAEIASLAHRARLVNLAISLSVIAALLVCVVIAALFVGSIVSADLARLVGLLFIGAMVALTGALLTFLRETQVATATIRIGAR